jgi:predicted aspartyl protease
LGREQDSLVSSIRLAKNELSIATKALMDTGANGYAFMDIFLAMKLAQHFQTYVILLGQPCAVKGYNNKTAMPITHLIRLILKIQGRVQ